MGDSDGTTSRDVGHNVKQKARGASGCLSTIRRPSSSRAGREEMLAYIVDRECPCRCGEGRSEQADPAQILGMSRSAVSLRDTDRVA